MIYWFYSKFLHLSRIYLTATAFCSGFCRFNQNRFLFWLNQPIFSGDDSILGPDPVSLSKKSLCKCWCEVFYTDQCWQNTEGNKIILKSNGEKKSSALVESSFGSAVVSCSICRSVGASLSNHLPVCNMRKTVSSTGNKVGLFLFPLLRRSNVTLKGWTHSRGLYWFL